MSTDEISFYDLRSALGPAIDWAIHQVAPGDRLLWDTGWTTMPTPHGPQLVGQLVVTMPSAVLGQGRLIVGSATDLARLVERSDALELIRHMVEILRDMKARQLKMSNGQAS